MVFGTAFFSIYVVPGYKYLHTYVHIYYLVLYLLLVLLLYVRPMYPPVGPMIVCCMYVLLQYSNKLLNMM